LILQKSDIQTNLLNRYRSFEIIYLFSKGKKLNFIFYLFYFYFSEGEIIFKRFDSIQKKAIQNILEDDVERKLEEKNIISHNPNKQKVMRMFDNKRHNNYKPNNLNFFKCKNINFNFF